MQNLYHLRTSSDVLYMHREDIIHQSFWNTFSTVYCGYYALAAHAICLEDLTPEETGASTASPSTPSAEPTLISSFL